jgi:hypothetical protein
MNPLVRVTRCPAGSKVSPSAIQKQPVPGPQSHGRVGCRRVIGSESAWVVDRQCQNTPTATSRLPGSEELHDETGRGIRQSICMAASIALHDHNQSLLVVDQRFVRLIAAR